MHEWRFEPRATPAAIIAMVMMSVGGVALGAGFYGQWLRGADNGPLWYAPYVLVAGVLLLGGFFVLGRNMPDIVRVGDLGVGIEKSAANIERLVWYEMSGIAFQDGVMRIRSKARTVSLSLAEHGAAVRRILSEALIRVPKRVEVRSEDRKRLGQPSNSSAQSVSIDPPQVTGMRCMNSGEALTFEQDTRICDHCGALYHKSTVPQQCVGCDAKLRVRGAGAQG